MPLTLLDDAQPPKPSTNYCDYSVWRRRLTQETVHKTRSAIEKAQLGYKRYYDRSAVNPKVSVGGQVYVKRHVPQGPNIKVSEKFMGPYRIHKILPHNKFEVISEKDLERWVVHWNHIKLVTSDPWSISELEQHANLEKNVTLDDGGSEIREPCRYPLRNRGRLLG